MSWGCVDILSAAGQVALHFECLVELDGGAQEGVDDVGVVVQLLVHHQGQDAHLGGAAVVQLDGQLLVDGLLVPAGRAELSLLDLVLSNTWKQWKWGK